MKESEKERGERKTVKSNRDKDGIIETQRERKRERAKKLVTTSKKPSKKNKNQNYRENEVVSQLKNDSQETDFPPYNLQIILRHEQFLRRKIDSFGLQRVTMRMHQLASLVSLVVETDDHQMIQKPFCAISTPKSLQEDVQKRTRSGPCRVDRRQYHCFIHRRRLSQHSLQLPFVGNILLWLTGDETENQERENQESDLTCSSTALSLLSRRQKSRSGRESDLPARW